MLAPMGVSSSLGVLYGSLKVGGMRQTGPRAPNNPPKVPRQACLSGPRGSCDKPARVAHPKRPSQGRSIGRMPRFSTRWRGPPRPSPPARPRRSSPPSPRQSHRYSLRVHCRRPVRGGSHASLRLGVLWSPQSLCNASHLGGSPLFEDGQHAGMSICRDSLQTAESLRPLLRRAQRNTHAHWRSSLASRQRAASCLSVDSG